MAAIDTGLAICCYMEVDCLKPPTYSFKFAVMAAVSFQGLHVHMVHESMQLDLLASQLSDMP